MVNYVDWNNIEPKKNPVCIVGAGFQKAVLCEGLPSTEDIIKKTVESQEREFPILSELITKKLSCQYNLNYIWRHIECLSCLLANHYYEIKSKYSLLNNKINKVIDTYENEYEKPPHTIIWVVLGLELKKMLAYQYDSTKINGKSSFDIKAFENLKILLKNEKTTWISLNYDIVLEQMLMHDFNNQKKFNNSFRGVKYSFDQLFGNSNIDDFRHLIIKPHGSLNIVFKTDDDQNSNNKIHSLCFKDKNDYLATFDWMEFGYDVNQNKITEKRPWLIGYLPDDMKDELNSRSYFSDLAHDLSKWNMATTSFALKNASSIFILAYSMPQEDEWIWARFRNIEDKYMNIYIASKCSSKTIAEELKRNGFKNINIINDGEI